MKTSESQRFSRISDIIDIKKLEHESRKFLYLGFVVAIMVHIIAGIYLSYRLPFLKHRIAEKKYREPIPVDIIILPPRIRNPYETWIKIILQKVYGRKEFVHRFPGGEIPVKQPLPLEEPQDDYYKYIDTGALIQAVLVAIYSDKGYGHFWHDGVIGYKHRDFASGSGEKYDFNPQLKIGVNMVVFALIQKEGITKQLVDYNAYRRK